MIRRLSLLSLALLLGLALLPLDVEAAPRAPKTARFRAMSFNIRFDFENDGSNRWPHRVATVAKVLRDSGASVIGLQEDKGEQIEDLRPLLPGYQLIGRGRNDNGSGERCTIAVKTEDVRVRESGDFWLSDTPDVPGSNTWNDRYPRKVTWALLEVERCRTLTLVLNTHLPERDDALDTANRVRGVRVMHDWIARRVSGRDREKVAVVIFGDYNSTPDEEPRAVLVGQGDDALALRDTFVEGRPTDPSPGTINNDFSGARTGARIDWILVGGPVRTLAYSKLDERVDGRWPSDHYPVMADLELR
jgi:endonuclease/exonuclease/phosphatase family metal-dependent hydrolase